MGVEKERHGGVAERGVILSHKCGCITNTELKEKKKEKTNKGGERIESLINALCPHYKPPSPAASSQQQ